LPNKHPLAANTGSAGEVTTVPTPFKHPTNENIIFWDLPGIGTPKYPDMKTFRDNVSIKEYDTFLIISATRFTENDRLLAMEVKSMEKSFFFIHTKIDQDLESAKDDSDYVDDETTLKTIKKKNVEKLQDFNVDKDTIFLISSRKRTKYDFERLKQAILDQLPSKQKESLTLSFRVHSKRDLTETIKLLKGMCDNFKCLSSYLPGKI
jgi:GTPase Era involved in 16S rRNA processing